MEIERKHGLNFNLKKIIRIKKKFNFKTVVRRKSIYRHASKHLQEHSVFPNLLNQNFNPLKAGVCFSTDITELRYNGQKAYLSAIKDLKTKEVVSFDIKTRPSIELVVKNLDVYLKSKSLQEKKRMIIHSDQGLHYTCFQYQNILRVHKVRQSMSRKGNCLDNAPIESFFGHLKDEVDYKTCKNFKELKIKIGKYINYYNKDRPQWGLKQKTPAEARVKL